jgi:hypothetical protein
VPPGLRLTVLQSVPVIVQPEGPQVQLRDPVSKFCDTLLKVSVRVRSETLPPPVFSIVPVIGYVTVPAEIFAVPALHVFDAVIAQVLKLPRRIDFIEAVEGELPEVTLANMTLLKQGATPPKTWLRSIPVSWNWSAGTTPPGNPGHLLGLTDTGLNPSPGA